MADARTIAALFRGQAVAVVDEVRLQAWVASELAKARVDYVEQFSLSPRDRLDFFCDGVAIELKTKGSPADLIRQLDRYAEDERVKELLVISTRRQLTYLPASLRDKPLFAVGVGAF